MPREEADVANSSQQEYYFVSNVKFKSMNTFKHQNKLSNHFTLGIKYQLVVQLLLPVFAFDLILHVFITVKSCRNDDIWSISELIHRYYRLVSILIFYFDIQSFDDQSVQNKIKYRLGVCLLGCSKSIYNKSAYARNRLKFK